MTSKSFWGIMKAAPVRNSHAIRGCILGTAVGDALGLPYEGLSPKRAEKLFQKRDRHHFLFGRGMISDDTEHTLLAALSIVESGGDPERFSKIFAGKLRYWLLSMPAGIGSATFRALAKLCVGFSPEKSGVRSAGNGPAMRTPVIGVAYGAQPDKMVRFVRLSTVVTHTDPKAFQGALAVALAAHMSATGLKIDGRHFLNRLETILDGRAEDLIGLARKAVESVEKKETTYEFARSLNLENGVTGYMLHTVPAVIHAWLGNPDDYRRAITDVIECGGDTDTTAAILGGIIGARVGIEGIPGEWVDGIAEWPMTVSRILEIADSLCHFLSEDQSERNLPLSGCGVSLQWPLVFLRNVVFTFLVILHGIRRLFPPY